MKHFVEEGMPVIKAKCYLFLHHTALTNTAKYIEVENRRVDALAWEEG